MWLNILTINSVLWTLSGIFLIYSLGAAIILWHWKQFLVALLVFLFLGLTEVALAAIVEP